jgi:hypothetical protein
MNHRSPIAPEWTQVPLAAAESGKMDGEERLSQRAVHCAAEDPSVASVHVYLLRLVERLESKSPRNGENRSISLPCEVFSNLRAGGNS